MASLLWLHFWLLGLGPAGDPPAEQASSSPTCQQAPMEIMARRQDDDDSEDDDVETPEQKLTREIRENVKLLSTGVYFSETTLHA